VPFYADLNITESFLSRQEAANNNGVCWIEMLNHFTGNVRKLNSDVLARSASLHESTSIRIGDAFEFGTIESELSRNFVLLGCIEIGGGFGIVILFVKFPFEGLFLGCENCGTVICFWFGVNVCVCITITVLI